MSSRMMIGAALLMSVVNVSATAVLAETAVVEATADAWIYLAASGENYGTADPMEMNGQPSAWKRQIVMKFDLSGVTTAPSLVVNSAELVLTTRAATDWGGNFAAHCRLLDADWNENTITWSNCPTTSTVISNAVMLKEKFADIFQQRTWTMTTEGRAQVAQWMLGGPNYGFKLMPEYPDIDSHTHQVHSRETANAADRPRLVIDYTPVYPPDAIMDLALQQADATRLWIQWTAPNGMIHEYDKGTYELRYSTSPIDDANFASATQVSNVPEPSVGGTLQTCMVDGLSPNQTYYFAIKSHAPVGGLISDLSNVLIAATTDVDVTAPAAVIDLAVDAVESRRLHVSWTATGDDGLGGPAASSYEVRYATVPLTQVNFAAAGTLVAQSLIPLASGQIETLTVAGLDPDTTYYVALEVSDEAANTSAISNAAIGTTLPADVIAPDAITDLAGVADSFRATLVWTAPADSGGGAGGAYAYDIRYATTPIDEGNWASATVVANPPVPASAGTQESLVVPGLAAQMTYYFAVKSSDDADPANVSALSNVLDLTTPPEKEAVVLINPWIVNDRVADCRSVATMGQTFIHAYTPDGVVYASSDQEKAINVYDNVKRRLYHWADQPPTPDDAVLNLNVFGWATCGRHVTIDRTISEAAGLPSRTIGLPGHWVYEVQYAGDWHLFDTMTTMYVYEDPACTSVASAQDIKNNHALMLTPYCTCPGYLLCGDSPEWYVDAIDSYGPSTPAVPTVFHSMDSTLRVDEAITRTWEHWPGHHPPAITYNDPPYHHEVQNDWKDFVNFEYWEPYGTVDSYFNTSKMTYRRYANGSAVLIPDFRTAAYQASVVSSSNIATYYDDGLTPDLHLATLTGPAEIVFKIESPFWLTGGEISGSFYRHDEADRVQLFVSTDGTSWTDAWSHAGTGTATVNSLNVSSNVYDNYSMYVKVLLEAGGSITDAGVNSLEIVAYFEHNKGAMAYLDKGVNNITVTCDNPEALGGGATFKVVYRWKEYDGADWTISRMNEQIITASPTTYTITAGGTKTPRTESITMELAAPVPPCMVSPLAVGDLTVASVDSTLLDLVWTAPTAGCPQSRIASYDIRYSTSPIHAGNWEFATPIANPPLPSSAGLSEQLRVFNLSPSTTYYFGLASTDNDENTSPISNIAQGTTSPPDVTPPEAIDDLMAATSTLASSVDLTWTAPGDDGNTGGPALSYDLRYATTPILNMTDFAAATPVANVCEPGTPGSTETVTVGGLDCGRMYYFAVLANDEADNWSDLSNEASASASCMGTLVLQQGVDGYTGVMDSFIRENDPSRNFDGNADLVVCGYNTPENQRTVIQFDLTGIDPGTAITEATLKLYANTKHGGSLPAYGVYELTQDWNQGSVTWNSATGTTTWTSPGGAYNPVPVATFTPTVETMVNAWYEWDITNLVQQWISNPSTNRGVLIKLVDETISSQTNFNSGDSATASLRPMLEVTDQIDADSVAPHAVTDLLAGGSDSNSLNLSWTAPIDQNDAGQSRAAATYDIRFSQLPITSGNFDAALSAPNPPSPATPGTGQMHTVVGLEPNTLYYFGIKSTDAMGNVSAISNVASGITAPPDTTAPDAITDLTAQTGTIGGTVHLTWTASGDDDNAGQAASYELRYSFWPISESTWSSATPVTGLPSPQPSGSPEQVVATGLHAGWSYFFAIKAIDDASNTSGISNCPVASAASLPGMLFQNGVNDYNGCADSFAVVGDPTRNRGADGQLVICGYGAGETQRSYIRFDVSSIPPGTSIPRATLHIYTWDKQGGSLTPYGAYRLTRDWVEMEMNWLQYATGVSWTTPGGDYDPTPVATFTPTLSVNFWHEWDITAAVQEWIDNPSSNQGLLLKVVDENINTQNRYCSANYTADPTLKPKLVIDAATAAPGDFNNSGSVDIEDFIRFVAALDGPGIATSDSATDLDFDADTDLADLDIFVRHYGM